MNEKKAKEILSAYRPDGRDAEDATFREALEFCRNTPGMSEWLEAELARDRALSGYLRSIRAPEEGRAATLAALRGETRDPGDPPSEGEQQGDTVVSFPASRSWWGIAAGFAALLALGVVLWQVEPDRSGREELGSRLAELGKSAMPLDYESGEMEDVLAWVREKGAPLPDKIPDFLRNARAAGCRVFDETWGGRASLLCFEVGEELVHVYVFDEDAAAQFPGPRGKWWEQDGWHMMTRQENGTMLAVVTRLQPSVLGVSGSR